MLSATVTTINDDGDRISVARYSYADKLQICSLLNRNVSSYRYAIGVPGCSLHLPSAYLLQVLYRQVVVSCTIKLDFIYIGTDA